MNSTVKLQDVVDYAKTIGDIAPALESKVGGYSTKPILMIANAVAAELLGSSAFPWKFNRMVVPMFLTTSWQQDYAQNVTTMAWMEHTFAVDINSSAIPKPHWTLEAVRDLEATSVQWGIPAKVSWLPNDQLTYGVWGSPVVGSLTNITNPGPSVVIQNPLGVNSAPINPITQIVDANGNLLTIKIYGTCGLTAPVLPANSAAGTTVVDGSVTWVVMNPKAYGFRIWPIPPQASVVYAINVIAQMKPPVFTALSQTLEPIPDDFAIYFQTGFVAQCYRHSPDPKVRARFASEWAVWKDSLMNAVRRGDREKDDATFYPSRSVMDTGFIVDVGPLNPYA
jgi:hypothetical protein